MAPTDATIPGSPVQTLQPPRKKPRRDYSALSRNCERVTRSASKKRMPAAAAEAETAPATVATSQQTQQAPSSPKRPVLPKLDTQFQQDEESSCSRVLGTTAIENQSPTPVEYYGGHGILSKGGSFGPRRNPSVSPPKSTSTVTDAVEETIQITPMRLQGKELPAQSQRPHGGAKKRKADGELKGKGKETQKEDVNYAPAKHEQPTRRFTSTFRLFEKNQYTAENPPVKPKGGSSKTVSPMTISPLTPLGSPVINPPGLQEILKPKIPVSNSPSASNIVPPHPLDRCKIINLLNDENAEISSRVTKIPFDNPREGLFRVPPSTIHPVASSSRNRSHTNGPKEMDNHGAPIPYQAEQSRRGRSPLSRYPSSAEQYHRHYEYAPIFPRQLLSPPSRIVHPEPPKFFSCEALIEKPQHRSRKIGHPTYPQPIPQPIPPAAPVLAPSPEPLPHRSPSPSSSHRRSRSPTRAEASFTTEPSKRAFKPTWPCTKDQAMRLFDLILEKFDWKDAGAYHEAGIMNMSATMRKLAMERWFKGEVRGLVEKGLGS